jgi:hypothetical protein
MRNRKGLRTALQDARPHLDAIIEWSAERKLFLDHRLKTVHTDVARSDRPCRSTGWSTHGQVAPRITPHS